MSKTITQEIETFDIEAWDSTAVPHIAIVQGIAQITSSTDKIVRSLARREKAIVYPSLRVPMIFEGVLIPSTSILDDLEAVEQVFQERNSLLESESYASSPSPAFFDPVFLVLERPEVSISKMDESDAHLTQNLILWLATWGRPLNVHVVLLTTEWSSPLWNTATRLQFEDYKEVQ